MKRKLIYILAIVLILALTLAACGEHEHEFDSKWSFDESNHWHKATCDDTDEVADKALHGFKDVGDGKTEKCETCGYTKNKPHEHTYATKYSSNEQSHWLTTTCGHNVENSAPHAYVDGICSTCGWWKSASEVLLAELSKMDVWDYTLTLNGVVLNNVNFLSEGIEQEIAIADGELKLSLSADGQLSGCGYIALRTGQSVKAVINDGAVYAIVNGITDEGNKYIRCTLDELLPLVGVDVNQITSYVDTINAKTEQIRDYALKLQSVLKYLPSDELDALVGQLVTVDNRQSTSNLTAYVIDYDVLDNLMEMLAMSSVAEYVDMAFGEGFFDGIPALVERLFDKKVYEIFELIEKNFGLTFDEVFELLDYVIANFYPDKDINTIDDLVAKNGIDLKGISVKATVITMLPFTLRQAIAMSQIGKDNKITVNDIIDKVTSVCNEYGDKRGYQLILGDDVEMTTGEVEQLVNDLIDELRAIPLTFFVDVDGVLSVITSDSENGVITFNRDLDLTQDYSRVIEEVNASLNAA